MNLLFFFYIKGVELYETANFPTLVINSLYKDNKVVDFDLGEDTLVILLDNNEVYWCGMKFHYEP